MPFLLASVVDQRADLYPNERFVLVAERADTTEGAKDVSWSDFRRAVDKAAAWIETNFGRPESGQPSLGFLSTPYDFRYFVFIVAAIKVGYKLFMPSPRNSPEFHLHLLETLDCKKIITSVPLDDWASSCQIATSPSFDELLDPAGAKPYPYTKTWEEAKHDKVIAVHSSGSTGPPKPIVWTNAYLDGTNTIISTQEAQNYWAEVITQKDGSPLVAMPLFHTGGLLIGPMESVILNRPLTMFPATVPLSAKSMTQAISTYGVKVAHSAPAIWEGIAADPEMCRVLEKLDHVSFGGGPISPDAGAAITKHVPIFSGIGTSECSVYPLLRPNTKESYLWWKFRELPGFVFEPQGDGTFELVFKRTDQFPWPVFEVFPDINEYPTNDIYEPHPTVKNVYKMISRKDDVLVLSNGEKVVPIPMEDIIRQTPQVTGVIYTGHARQMVAAVIELKPTARDQSEDDIHAAIKPFLDHANEIAPGFARLTPNMITFTKADKPMTRTGKGSIVRKMVLKEYAKEIEALYSQDGNSNVKLVQGLDEAGTVAAVTDIFKQLSGKIIGPNDDFFQAAGIDSMQVLAATRILRSSVKAEATKQATVVPGLIYDHPTISQLSQAVRSLVENGSTGGDDPVEAMNEVLLKYSEGLAASRPAGSRKLASPEVVILTGSTGSLGSYMLDILIRDPSIKHIFALNRSENGSSRQTTSNASRGLSTDFSKVTFHTADFGSKNLGLSASTYESLLESDLIIHNAWPVDFNQSLASFEPHIRGVRNFIDLASTSPRNPQIVFISSIGTTSGWDAFYPGQLRPEALLRDARVAAGQGYGAGKYVSEHLLNAAGAAGVSATIARVGQVAGPVQHGTKGLWNKQEWFPSIIASSKYLGLLPDSFGNDEANWVPVDSMAQAVIQLGMNDIKKRAPEKESNGKGAFAVYNLVNPKGGSYKALIDTVRANMPEIKDVVSFEEWVKALRASSEKEDNDLSKNPATKLLDFYEGLVGNGMPGDFETDAATGSSKEMRELDAVKPEWMDIWMKQWNF